jgi:leader peptidase (prepilin peptidase)/N-methyltransferase
MLFVLFLLIFLLGSFVGCLLNICISRLPLEKSIFWPSSRCGHCIQSIQLLDMSPLINYWIRGGRCRTCGAALSRRPFAIEVVTGLAFAGLFYLIAVLDIQHLRVAQPFPKTIIEIWMPSGAAWLTWIHHCVLFCFLFMATMCDLDYREIPFSITIPGTIVGLLFSASFPWPWPHGLLETYDKIPAGASWWSAGNQIAGGLYPWPFWGPLPPGFAPGFNLQTGLATGVIGAAVGWIMIWCIRFVFSKALGIEAMGLGDADLMMMAGSFLGWQGMVVGFILGIFIGLFFGVAQMFLRGDNMLPFGPSLALGTMLSCLGWTYFGTSFQAIFFHPQMLPIMIVLIAFMMAVAAYILRLIRLVRA